MDTSTFVIKQGKLMEHEVASCYDGELAVGIARLVKELDPEFNVSITETEGGDTRTIWSSKNGDK